MICQETTEYEVRTKLVSPLQPPRPRPPPRATSTAPEAKCSCPTAAARIMRGARQQRQHKVNKTLQILIPFYAPTRGCQDGLRQATRPCVRPRVAAFTATGRQLGKLIRHGSGTSRLSTAAREKLTSPASSNFQQLGIPPQCQSFHSSTSVALFQPKSRDTPGRIPAS